MYSKLRYIFQNSNFINDASLRLFTKAEKVFSWLWYSFFLLKNTFYSSSKLFTHNPKTKRSYFKPGLCPYDDFLYSINVPCIIRVVLLSLYFTVKDIMYHVLTSIDFWNIMCIQFLLMKYTYSRQTKYALSGYPLL